MLTSDSKQTPHGSSTRVRVIQEDISPLARVKFSISIIVNKVKRAGQYSWILEPSTNKIQTRSNAHTDSTIKRYRHNTIQYLNPIKPVKILNGTSILSLFSLPFYSTRFIKSIDTSFRRRAINENIL